MILRFCASRLFPSSTCLWDDTRICDCFVFVYGHIPNSHVFFIRLSRLGIVWSFNEQIKHIVSQGTEQKTLKRSRNNSYRLSWDDTHNRHIISMKSEGSVETPQDIMEEYNGCSVPQYTRYPCDSSVVDCQQKTRVTRVNHLS